MVFRVFLDELEDHVALACHGGMVRVVFRRIPFLLWDAVAEDLDLGVEIRGEASMVAREHINQYIHHLCLVLCLRGQSTDTRSIYLIIFNT